MVGFEMGEVLVMWVWLTLDAPKGAPCCRCLGDCCLGNWARIWAGEPTRVLGEGSLAEVIFSPAAEAPRKVNTDEVSAIFNLGEVLNLKVSLRAVDNPHKMAQWQFEETLLDQKELTISAVQIHVKPLLQGLYIPVFCLTNSEDPPNL